jgi:hypothetical protein
MLKTGGQTMTEIITGIDHPIIAVRDMAAARTAYERLGFTITPRGSHPEWGTGNWCIMFENDYLELRGIIDPNQTHNLGRFLTEREGLMGLALGTGDAQASYETLVQGGLSPQPVRQLSRNFELPEGTVQPRFSLCFLDVADTPGLMWVVLCQHLTPELLRRPAWLNHANGARGVRAVTGVVPDLGAAAERHTRIFGRPAITRRNDRLAIQVNARQTITLMNSDAARAAWPEIDLSTAGETGFLLSVEIEVQDSRQTELYFASRGIESYRSAAGALRVLPRFTCGVPLEFAERS